MGCLTRSRIWKSQKWERNRSKAKNVEYRRLREWLNNEVKEPNKITNHIVLNSSSTLSSFILRLMSPLNKWEGAQQGFKYLFLSFFNNGIQISLTQISLFLWSKKEDDDPAVSRQRHNNGVVYRPETQTAGCQKTESRELFLLAVFTWI